MTGTLFGAPHRDKYAILSNSDLWIKTERSHSSPTSLTVELLEVVHVHHISAGLNLSWLGKLNAEQLALMRQCIVALAGALDSHRHIVIKQIPFEYDAKSLWARKT